jgi:hypothetical protein
MHAKGMEYFLCTSTIFAAINLLFDLKRRWSRSIRSPIGLIDAMV